MSLRADQPDGVACEHDAVDLHNVPMVDGLQGADLLQQLIRVCLHLLPVQALHCHLDQNQAA